MRHSVNQLLGDTMKITVQQRDQYGTTVFHPVCASALLFAQIAKTKTLTREALRSITALGYEIEIAHPTLETI